MMMFDHMLRTGVWLRRRKRMLPWAFIVSVIIALMITPPFTMIKNTILLTVVSILLAVVGFVIRYYAAQTRSMLLPDIVEAKGIFSIVRFPIYLSNIIIMLALTIYVGIVWYFVFAALVGWLVIEKIVLNEENALQNKYGDVFLQWTKHTRCVVPNIINWEKPQYKVSKMEVLRTQSVYLLLTVTGFTAINLLKNIMIDFSFRVDAIWIIALVSSLAIFLISKIGKRSS